MIYAIFGEQKFPITENDTISAVKENISKFYPEVLNYEGYRDEDNNICFRATGGTKGI